MTDRREWTCTTCGRVHGGLPPALNVPMPLVWYELPQEERKRRVLEAVENEAIVVADMRGDAHFCLRGVVQIPTAEERGVFQWTVWAEISDEVFRLVVNEWFDKDRIRNTPRRGILGSRIPGYPETYGLAVEIRQRPVGERPLFVVIDDHPLRTEQEHGITAHRHSELVVPFTQTS